VDTPLSGIASGEGDGLERGVSADAHRAGIKRAHGRSRCGDAIGRVANGCPAGGGGDGYRLCANIIAGPRTEGWRGCLPRNIKDIGATCYLRCGKCAGLECNGLERRGGT